ncbi:hypothetical protein BC832DRAFT_569357 [Gaertneriomyces semiglobifer]|nr:hypothetical protein BC832DRAFT_569357 [Gaertneriomyces semiglobifer]
MEDVQYFNEDAILSFCEITGSDPDIAKSYLTVSEGNTEQAISLFMENGGAPLTNTDTAGPAGPSSAPSGSDIALGPSLGPSQQAGDGVRAPIAPKREVLIGGDDDLDDDAYTPQDRDISPVVGRSIGRRGYRHQPPPPPQLHTTLASGLDGRLAQLFRAPLEIMRETGSLDQARETAKKEDKWILLTLIDPTEFQCQALNRDLWKDKSVQDFIRENFYFIYWPHDSAQGRNHRSLYPVDNYPYICIIDPLTGERVRQWYTSLSPAAFLEQVSEFTKDHAPTQAPPSKKVRTSAKKSITELTEDEQLELALAASMNQVSAGSPSGSVEDLVDKDVAMDTTSDSDNVWDSIAPLDTPEPPAGPTATRIQFRLPDGTRQVRRFLLTDKVRSLFGYIKATVSEAAEKPFELKSFRDSLLERLNMTLEEAKLVNAAVTMDFL